MTSVDRSYTKLYKRKLWLRELIQLDKDYVTVQRGTGTQTQAFELYLMLIPHYYVVCVLYSFKSAKNTKLGKSEIQRR